MINRSVKFVRASALLLCLTSAFSAHAAMVSVTGGFTRFQGLASGTAAGCDPTFQAFVAGARVNGPVCTGGLLPDGTHLYGPASYTFPSTRSSFEFFERQFGSDLTHNGFSFVPFGDATVTNVGQQFPLGTLTFTNGTWFGSGQHNIFQIDLKTESSDPAFDGKILSDGLIMNIRVGDPKGSNTPEDNADCFSFGRFTTLGQVCAYERGVPGRTNTTSAIVWGRIGSLIPTQFTDVTGGFLIADASAVPEPSSLLLVGAGLAAFFLRRRTKT